MKSNKNKNQTKYIIGEMAGKTSVFLVKCSMLALLIGYVCELSWDISERRQNKNKNKD